MTNIWYVSIYRIVIYFFTLATLGCGWTSVSIESRLNPKPRERVFGYAYLSSPNVQAQSSIAALCASSNEIQIFEYNHVRKQYDQIVATAKLDSQGRFEFFKDEITPSLNGNRQLLMRTQICDTTLLRLVTDEDRQDINTSSTLLSWITQTGLIEDLSLESKTQFTELLKQFGKHDDFQTAYDALIASDFLKSMYRLIFSVDPALLLDSSPWVEVKSIKKSLSENTTSTFSIQAFHWFPTYEYFVAWTLPDGSVQKGKDLFEVSWTSSKNSQGIKNLTVEVGAYLNGGFSSTGERQILQVPLEVQNTFPAVPLVLSLVQSHLGNNEVDLPQVNLKVLQGVAQEKCATFSKFAITVNDPLPPTLLTDFQFSCDSLEEQVIPWLLPTTGTTVFRLWSVDSSGNVSSASSKVEVHYSPDHLVPPRLAVNSPADFYRAKHSVNVSGTCEPNLSFSITGPGILEAQNSVQCGPSGEFILTLFFSAGDGNKVFNFYQKKSSGVFTSFSKTYVRDTTPPLLTQNLVAPISYSTLDSHRFGGSCEPTHLIEVSGAATDSLPCPVNGTWTYDTPSVFTDGSRSFNFRQIDEAGNEASVSAQWIRKTSEPIFLFTSSSDFLTTGDSVTFKGQCESGLKIFVNANLTPILCSSGSWSYTAHSTIDGVLNYSFKGVDLALNEKTLLGSWTRSTTGPRLILAQNQVSSTISNFVISGQCSAGSSGSDGLISLTGAQVDSIPCPSTDQNLATWQYTVSPTLDGVYQYTFSLSDYFVPPRKAQEVFTFVLDREAPVLTKLISVDGSLTSRTPNIEVKLEASDTLSPITAICIKTSADVPEASDSCWYPLNGPLLGMVPALSVSVPKFPINLGVIPSEYNVYAWVRDSLGNTSHNQKIPNVDYFKIQYAPVPPPMVGSVIASNNNVMNGDISEATFSAGQGIYIRWKAVGQSLKPLPVQIFFSMNDEDWIEVTPKIANANINCPQLTSSGNLGKDATGCYHWSSGAPTSKYFKIRVAVDNIYGAVAFSNSAPLNADGIGLLAGNLESGVGGSALAATFLTEDSMGRLYLRNQSLLVTNSGVIYLSDFFKGILKINPSTGVLESFIKKSSTCQRNYQQAVSVSSACVLNPQAVVLDQNEDLIIFDQDRLLKVSLGHTPATIKLIAGGGANTAHSVTDPFDLKINNTTLNVTTAHTILKVLPNNDILFTADSLNEGHLIKNNRNLRILSQSGSGLRMADIGGVGFHNAPAANITECGIVDIGFTYTPGDVEASDLFAYLRLPTASPAGCPGNTGDSAIIRSSRLSPTTYKVDISQKAHPTGIRGSYSSRSFVSLGGKAYSMTRQYIDEYRNGSFVKILGDANIGFCPDKTPANECSVDIDDIYVTSAGRLYFLSRGVIRMVDADGLVNTVFGSGLGGGDGDLAINARFKKIGMFDRSANGNVMIYDSSVYTIREFKELGNINSIIGNGKGGTHILGSGSASLTQPLPLSSTSNEVAYAYYLDDHNITFGSTLSQLAVWNRQAGFSSLAIGTNSGEDYRFIEDTPDKNRGDKIRINPPAVSAGRIIPVGAGGGRILAAMEGLYPSSFTRDSWLVEINSGNNFSMQPLVRAAGTDRGNAATFCADGISLVACAPSNSQSAVARYSTSQYWEEAGQHHWFVLHVSNSKRIMEISGESGAVMKTLVTLNDEASAFTRVQYNSKDYVFYCSRNSNKLVRVELFPDGSTFETTLPWPDDSLACTGKSLVFDIKNAKPRILFQIEQFTLQGVASHEKIF